ncbi:MAG: glycine cleavage system protein GcvH [Smithella sp.]
MQIENWQIREGLKYDSNNLWVEIEGHQALIGLTDYGQWVIGDILYLDLATEGSILAKGEKFGSVESGKWVGNLISPVNGRVLQCNASVVTQPRQIQADPYGTGWMMRIELAANGEEASLLDDAAYAEFVKEQIKNAA